MQTNTSKFALGNCSTKTHDKNYLQNLHNAFMKDPIQKINEPSNKYLILAYYIEDCKEPFRVGSHLFLVVQNH